MQVERFRLFRQDIRDLVELTVQKMDLYHMVGQGKLGWNGVVNIGEESGTLPGFWFVLSFQPHFFPLNIFKSGVSPSTFP